MRNQKTLLSLAVAAALGAVSLQVNAAGPSAPTVYGDLAVTALYTGSNLDGTGAGSSSSYGVYDDVSLLGVKGDLGTVDGTRFFYDFNFILNVNGGTNASGLPFTHLSIVGAENGAGTFTFGVRDNYLFENWVDGVAYLTNWFYTPGMSAFQVSNSFKYVTPAMSGFQLGLQAFDIGKSSSSGETTTNYTAAGTFTTGGLTFALGYTDYSKYADGTLGGPSSDVNMFGESTNSFAGILIESNTGASVTWKADKLTLVGAYDMRSPYAYAGGGTFPNGSTVSANTNTNSIDTLMLTGSYALTDKWTAVANYSDTSQSGGVKGTIITAMISYAPSPAVLYSLELQTSDQDANVYGITGKTGVATGVGAKSSDALALSAVYTF